MLKTLIATKQAVISAIETVGVLESAEVMDGKSCGTDTIESAYLRVWVNAAQASRMKSATAYPACHRRKP